jgi:sialic acid synthase SpsE
MGHTFIIAEAGLSHCGDLDHAKELVKAAKEAGADIFKTQTFFGKFPDLKQYELTKPAWKSLFETCDAIGIEWMSTPFDREAIDFLAECGMKRWKISSGMVTNLDFISYVKEKKPEEVLLSIGMCNGDEVGEALGIFLPEIKPTILQCTTAYPAPYEEANLNVMRYWDPWLVGLSDHTMGFEVSIAAIALGASVIEKHFCLSRKGKGPDDHMSLEPHEFKEMVRCIRNVELAMGDFVKKPTPSEMEVRDTIRARMVGG